MRDAADYPRRPFAICLCGQPVGLACDGCGYVVPEYREAERRRRRELTRWRPPTEDERLAEQLAESLRIRPESC